MNISEYLHILTAAQRRSSHLEMDLTALRQGLLVDIFKEADKEFQSFKEHVIAEGAKE